MRCHQKDCTPWLPARYILAFLGFMGITLQYILKVNLSVAIVAMVYSRPKNTSDIEDTCPREGQDPMDSGNSEGEFSWNTDMQGILLSSYYYGYVSSQLMGGYVAQRFGGRLVLGPGVAVTALLTLLTAVVARSSFVGLCVLRALEGWASGVVIPSMQSMFSRWYPEQERQRFSGFIFSSIHFGSLAGMGLSGLLADWGGWPAVFYVTGAAALVWFVFWMFLAYDSPNTHPRISKVERDYIIKGLGQDPSSVRTARKVPWKHIFLSPAVWAAILLHTGSAWVMYTMLNELPTYLSTILNYDVKNSGVLSSLPYLFGWISGTGTGALSQWIRSKGYISHLTAYRIFNGIFAVGVSICFLVIIVVGCDARTIIAMFILAMFCNGCIYGGSYMNHVDLAPNHAGAISGLLHTVINMPGFITPVVTSALLHDQGTRSNWKKVFGVSIGVVCVTYVIYLIFGSVTERKWNSYGMDDKRKNEKKKKSASEESDLKMNVSTVLKTDLEAQHNYGS